MVLSRSRVNRPLPLFKKTAIQKDGGFFCLQFVGERYAKGISDAVFRTLLIERNTYSGD